MLDHFVRLARNALLIEEESGLRMSDDRKELPQKGKGKRHRKSRHNGASGEPAPGKDRSQHEASRGQTLDFSKLAEERLTDEEINSFHKVLGVESDRSAVIMASARVEQELLYAIRYKLPHLKGAEAKTWFTGSSAPFRTFEAKTRLGRALDIFDENVEDRLDLIRKIRNVFAHRPLPITLEYPALAKLVMQLDPTAQMRTTPLKFVFASYALAAAVLLRAISTGRRERPLHADRADP